MADPKDTSGAPGPAPLPAVPSIPRLTPAVPEPLAEAEPVPPSPPAAAPGGLPAPPAGPPVLPAVPPVAPVARAPAPGRPGARSPTGSMPAVPAVAPLVPPHARTPPGSIPAVPPVSPAAPPPGRTPTGSIPAVPAVAPLVPPHARTPPSSIPAVPPVSPAAPPPERTPTGPIPAVPPVAPLTPAARTSTGSMPAVPPLPPRTRTGAGLPAPATPPPEAAPSAASELASLEHRYGLLDELDYFQVMGLALTATPADIKLAFHHESRTYHPDRFFQSPDLELRDKVQAVYKRVTEAYFVLRDDTRRKRYLADITGPDRQKKLRFDELAEAEAKAAVKKEVAEQIGTHPKGRQFFQSGLADLEAGRLSAAERNIKLALTYEPANPLYKQKLEETQAKLHEEFKKSGKGFRIE
jgi:hypothetical protein